MLRVGSVPYLVARPLDLGLERESGIELVHAVPAQLVEGLRSGSLDVALVSSIELFRRPGYSFLDGLAVAGASFVSSVQVFLRRPISEIRSVALDPASRSAAVLTRLVWPASALPEFHSVADGEDPRASSADAWLRIGDAAIREYAAPLAPPVFNPSQAWREATGLPFVFALWVARPGVELEEHRESFARSRALGAAALEELALRAAREWRLPAELCRRYLAGECLYEPGKHLVPSLRAFRDRAAGAGLARGELEPRAIPLSLERVDRR